MPASTYVGNAILNHFLRGQALVAPTRHFISLHTQNPGPAGAHEVTIALWPAYARQDAAAGGGIDAAFKLATTKATENTNLMVYPAHDGDDPVVAIHFGIWDAPEGGNLLFYGALGAEKTLSPTDELAIYPDQLDVTVA